VFDYCGMIQKKCPFATRVGDFTHCGVMKGNFEQTKVIFMKKCPIKKKKN